MATASVLAHAAGGRATYLTADRTVERGFYSGMSILLCICVYIGFAATYFRAGVLSAPLGAYDLITTRRIRRSTMWAAPVMFAAIALTVPIGMTPARHALAGMLNRTIRSDF